MFDVVAQRVDEVLHVAFGLGEDLAAVEGLDLGDDRLALLDGVGQPVQQHAALVGRHFGPAGLGERRGRGLHGPIHVVRLHGGDLGQHLLRTRVAGLERLAVRGRHVLAADHGQQRAAFEKRFDFGQGVFVDAHGGAPG